VLCVPRQRRSIETFLKWLEILKRCDGKRSISEIANELGMRMATVSEYLDDLSELGLVELVEIREPPRKIVCKAKEKAICIEKCFS